MKISQLLHAMDKEDQIVIDDYNARIDHMTIYEGPVRGIKRDDPINRMHVSSVCDMDDKIMVLVEKQRAKERR